MRGGYAQIVRALCRWDTAFSYLHYSRVLDIKQVLRNTDSAEGKGYDAGKKISGIKWHIAVDTQGLPHALAVTAANVTERAPCSLLSKIKKS